MTRTRQHTETAEQKSAFRIYHNMGPNRSLKDLSDQIGVSRQTLTKWVKKWKWEQRLALVQDKVTEEIVRDLAVPIATEISTYLRGFSELLADFFTNYKMGASEFQIRSPKDLKDMVEVWAKVRSMADPRDKEQQEADANQTTLSSILQEPDGAEVLALIKDALKSDKAKRVESVIQEAELVDEDPDDREWREFLETLPEDKRAGFDKMMEAEV